MPEAYPWSSYQELWGGSPWKIVDRGEVSQLIGKTPQEQEAYRQLVLEGIKTYEAFEEEYSFEKEVVGSARFHSLAQKKYLRRKRPK